MPKVVVTSKEHSQIVNPNQTSTQGELITQTLVSQPKRSSAKLKIGQTIQPIIETIQSTPTVKNGWKLK